ncbi:MAG: hypothetical protein ACJ77K_11150 [Bacteroidia bacterium]
MRSLSFLLSFALLAITRLSFSQEQYWNRRTYQTYPIYESNQNMQENAAGHLKELRTRYNKFRWSETDYKYDGEGRVIEYSYNKTRFVVTYSDSLRRHSLAKYKRGKIVFIDSLTWSDRRLKEVKSYGRKSKLERRESYQYDSTMLREYVYEKNRRGDLREFRKTTYEYYPDLSNKKITYYKKGKIKRYSVFDCDPHGITHKAKKDSAFNCVKYDVDSLGNKIQVTIVNQKGYSVKTIKYFNSSDQVVAAKTYDTKEGNPLLWEYHYKPGTYLTTHFISYKGKKKIYEFVNNYNDKNKCVSSATYGRRKLKEKMENEFNDQGFVAKTKYYNRRNKLRSATDYSYTYY